RLSIRPSSARYSSTIRDSEISHRSTSCLRIRWRSRSKGPSKTDVDTSYDMLSLCRRRKLRLCVAVGKAAAAAFSVPKGSARAAQCARPRQGPQVAGDSMPRFFSGTQRPGEMHLGTYVGAVRRWGDAQARHAAISCVVALHAMTLPYPPAELAGGTRRT